MAGGTAYECNCKTDGSGAAVFTEDGHGAGGCVNIDECLGVNSCDGSAVCQDQVPTGLNAYEGYVCTCGDGYDVDYSFINFEFVLTCTDTDECDISQHACRTAFGAVCGNTLYGSGSNGLGYSCSCPVGYKFESDDFSDCVDIDECEEDTDGCGPTATCINNSGNFTLIIILSK